MFEISEITTIIMFNRIEFEMRNLPSFLSQFDSWKLFFFSHLLFVAKQRRMLEENLKPSHPHTYINNFDKSAKLIYHVNCRQPVSTTYPQFEFDQLIKLFSYFEHVSLFLSSIYSHFVYVLRIQYVFSKSIIYYLRLALFSSIQPMKSFTSTNFIFYLGDVFVFALISDRFSTWKINRTLH